MNALWIGFSSFIRALTAFWDFNLYLKKKIEEEEKEGREEERDLLSHVWHFRHHIPA